MARVLFALLAAAILVFAGAAQAAPANALRTTPTKALTRLLDDTAALSGTDASATTRRRLAALASGALKNSFARPCRAVALTKRDAGALKYGADDVSSIVSVR